MPGSTFETNPNSLQKLLEQCRSGELQLPDFQRSWVWDEDRIKSLAASISRAFPVGAVMTLKTGGDVNFKPRSVEGAPPPSIPSQALLLDGQQRLTSLYQVTLRNQVVETVTPKNKRVKRWFYIDIRKALNPEFSREEAIIGVPEDRIVKANFDKDIVLDLSSREKEFDALMYPLSMIFQWNDWQMKFVNHSQARGNFAELWPMICQFHDDVVQNFASYQVPVIALGKDTSKEAVCLVFEKVNTGGKPLDAFELVTAMYAADGHELRRDWYGDSSTKGRHRLLIEMLRPPGQNSGILAQVSNTDFLQAISLFHTRDKRRQAETDGKQGKELPAVSGNRQSLLNLPLSAYLKYQALVDKGFERAAKFLNMLHIYRVFDLPYQSQIVPLAAILADIGDAWESETNRMKLVQWYWNGVFGELYGSAVDSRISRDFLEVPLWLKDGPVPSTVSETIFRSDRLKTMRMRLSAAYKGVNALLMKEGAEDFRSGQAFDDAIFFGESVDIHHIFPKQWCANAGIKADVFDSIINKTPLSYKTNRIIGGVAPSAYLQRLQTGTPDTPAINADRLDQILASHLIDPALIRADSFAAFMADRQSRLLALIEKAMGKAAYTGDVKEEGVDDERDEDGAEAEMTIAAD
ncbi:MAG: DUF262 domain-containing protein [Mesorhizobium sp.]|uniref:GmrSD restriction endonuclease domain-containing protein n=1 Tax=Mesorhizobium sp. TaxID=1871066 RepID=UPI000FEA463E|nr:DUF262 domain-containing protein [Mesorhizobium sp.]RWE83373.1 MAG: DUF262 domain-containing protein [Mesorhizobium sp.]TJW64113.1 MAG: DUF262 domain-containing protein [Mesorhizobium sp.]